MRRWKQMYDMLFAFPFRCFFCFFCCASLFSIVTVPHLDHRAVANAAATFFSLKRVVFRSCCCFLFSLARLLSLSRFFVVVSFVIILPSSKFIFLLFQCLVECQQEGVLTTFFRPIPLSLALSLENYNFDSVHIFSRCRLDSLLNVTRKLVQRDSWTWFFGLTFIISIFVSLLPLIIK